MKLKKYLYNFLQTQFSNYQLERRFKAKQTLDSEYNKYYSTIQKIKNNKNLTIDIISDLANISKFNALIVFIPKENFYFFIQYEEIVIKVCISSELEETYFLNNKKYLKIEELDGISVLYKDTLLKISKESSFVYLGYFYREKTINLLSFLNL